MSKRRLLILSQVYVPDPAAVGQHLHDFAAEMARRGHDVVVYCSSRGYDDPDKRYARKETIDGVKIRRYALPFYNKKKMLTRIIGSAWAMTSLVLMALFNRRVGCVFFSTSPPLVGFPATLVAMLKRVPRVYWAMDLNPDQLLVMGKVKRASLLYRVLESVNRFILKRATLTIVLDRFMEERVRMEGRTPRDVRIVPAWSQDVVKPVSHDQNWFREKHGLNGKFVVMYSGNHGLNLPLDTLLEAASQMQDDPRVVFAFIGGGAAKPMVDEFIRSHGMTNVLSLPYQPLADIAFSLSAADVHVISIGNPFVGVIHPCKIYGAMAVSRPVLYLGPKPSHVSDILDQHPIGWHVSHGDVAGCLAVLREISNTSADKLAEMGNLARNVFTNELSHSLLCTKVANAVEEVVDLR